MPNSLKSRLKGLVRKGLLSEKELSRIYTDNDVIEELEKIKAKIDNIIYGMEMCDEISTEAYLQITLRTERIFDEHISELKGENK